MRIPKILYLDTSRFFLEIHKDLLADPTFKLFIATDSQQALKVMQSEHLDLILMDISVPRLDKGKFCAELSSNPDNSLTPLVMIVDADHPEDINDAIMFGCRDYISHPLDRKTLIETIRTYIPVVNRRVPRINCNIPVVLQFEETLVMVPCDNISIDGMFVKSSLEIPAGKEVVISFRLPGDAKTKTQIRAKGHVVWISKKRSLHSKVPKGFGIKIDEIFGHKISKRRSDELMAFIEAHHESP